MMYQPTNYYIKVLFLCCLSGMGMLRATAQQSNTAKIAAELQKVQDAYKAAKAMSFHVQYVYANETNPAMHLDSLSGQIEMSDSRYRVSLDNTETIQTGAYTILLFKEDKIMYLARPVANSNNLGPLAAVDSLFAHSKGLTGEVSRQGGYEIVDFSFPAGRQYKKMSFTIDTATYFIVSTTYTVKTEQLMGPLTNKEAYDKKMYSQYALVQALFSQYTIGQVPDSLFDASAFFVREGKDFKTTDRYKEYKIFIGTPNL